MNTDIRNQVMWNRLLSVVEEQARTLVRTAFSTSAREAGDISAGVFDLQGQMLAQAVTGTPGHVNSMARSVVHFLREFPAHTMKPGDHYITNDPWKGTGHLYDLVVTSPAFHDGRLVALFSSTTHLVDIGGVGQSAEGKQVFHEGLFIPLIPLAREGVVDETVMRIIRANVREPVQVEGDVFALMACNETGERRLSAMLRENDLRDLDALGDYIITRSRAGMAAAIQKLPKGTWKSHMRIDGVTDPIDLHATVTIAEDHIAVDYAGTSAAVPFGINCPLCYTEAYTAFGVKCLVGAEIPNNAGTLDAVIVTRRGQHRQRALPLPRHRTFDHGAHAARRRVRRARPGDPGARAGRRHVEPVEPEARRGAGIHGAEGAAFMVTSFHSGGTGARPNLDGLSATPFPSGVRNVPVEVTEAITPLVVWKKELREGSGGAGRYRGGLGQVIEVGRRDGEPFGIFATFERVKHPARGRAGGSERRAGAALAEVGHGAQAQGLSRGAGGGQARGGNARRWRPW